MDFSNHHQPDIPDIPDIPVIPQPEQKQTSFFESEVKPMKEEPKEEKKMPDIKAMDHSNWPAYISMAAAAIGFLSPLRWVVNILVGVVIRLFRLYYFYPIMRFISFMYGFMHWVCIILCLVVVAGLSYLLSIEKSENQRNDAYGIDVYYLSGVNKSNRTTKEKVVFWTIAALSLILSLLILNILGPFLVFGISNFHRSFLAQVPS